MPSFDWTPVDEAIQEMQDIGYGGWLAKRHYIEGRIGEAELESRLDRSMGIGSRGR